ncbi:B3 domain-containing protein Os03g0212300-like [Triticum urartu]|uniref:B3 domain-containing protein Os03g0212300-like n=1 Tax=Triticum urartu TaxID=4572 RepID=UPI002044C6ED|nr:B3 domain-containing protein Os03g0212300-like [Triticum urartu]XP_048574464.1 B3 domain-containing protein Os03g0212300-like [Triticum urartu]
MAGLEGFEFFEIVIEKSCSRQRLPDKFAKMLVGREPHKVKLLEAGSGLHRLWDVLVVFDGEGHMYLGPGWEHFARAHELQLGYFLVFRYDGDATFTVKMFDNTMCRMYYQQDDDATAGMTRSKEGMTRTRVGKKRSRAGMTTLLWWWLTTTLLWWWLTTTLLWWWLTTTSRLLCLTLT